MKDVWKETIPVNKNLQKLMGHGIKLFCALPAPNTVTFCKTCGALPRED